MEAKNTLQANATEVLKQLTLQRNWYGAHMDKKTANKIKKAATEGTIKYSTACDTLAMLGWQKVKEETWQQLAEDEQLQAAANTPGVEHIRRSVSVMKGAYTEELKKPVNKRIYFGGKKAEAQLQAIKKNQPK